MLQPMYSNTQRSVYRHNSIGGNKMIGKRVMLSVLAMAVTLSLWIIPARADMYVDLYISTNLKVEESYLDFSSASMKTRSFSINMIGAVAVQTDLEWEGIEADAYFAFIYPNGRIIEIDCTNYDGGGIFSTTYTFNPWKLSTEKFHTVMSCEAHEIFPGFSYIGHGSLDVKGTWNERKNTINATGKFLSGSYFDEIVTSTIVVQLIPY